MKKRLLYVITRGETGGAQTHVLDLIRGLRNDFDMAAAVGTGGYLPRSLKALGVPVYAPQHLDRSISPTADAKAIRELLRIMRAYQPDLVHMHSSKAGFLGRIAARIAGFPSVYTVHGWAFTDGVPVTRRAISLLSEAACGRLSARIITVSEHDRELCLKYRLIATANVATIRNGVADSPWRATPGALGQTIIAMVARFEAQKDHETLLKAIADVQEDCRVRLIGDGPYRERVQKQVNELGLSRRVEFMGMRRDVPELLSASHVLVLASKWEGLPICVLEAMRAGLPVVASDVGGVGEAVQDGVTGFLAKRGDAEGLRELLLLLLRSPGLRARMGAEGRRRYTADFTLDSMLSKTRDLYREVFSLSTTARTNPVAYANIL